MDLVRSVKKRLHIVRSLVTDPESLSLTEEKLLQDSKLDKNLQIFEDRKAEVIAYYGISPDELESEIHKLKQLGEKEPCSINEAFYSDENLFNHYRSIDLIAATSHMCLLISYYRIAFKLIQYFNSFYPRRERHKVTVLDYGCGAADYAVAFASQGYRVRVADIAGGPIGFAKWRLEQRGFDFDVVEVSEANLYPDLGQNTIVLAGEVLEHIRDPLRLIRNMDASLPRGGFFWTSGFPVLEREVGDDHLPEAAEQRPLALNYLNEQFKSVELPPLPGYLFRK